MNNPLFNPFTLFGLLVIAYACLLAALYTGFQWTFHPVLCFPVALVAGYFTWRKLLA